MQKLSEKDIENIKIRLTKHEDLTSKNVITILNLCKHYLFLLSENKMLRQELFDVEQTLPEENRWQSILATKLQLAINSQKKSCDFLEIVNSINNESYIITIQKKFGNTPNQLLKKSEIRRLKAVNKIVNLQKIIKELKGENQAQKATILSFKLLRDSTLEGLEATKAQLIKSYEILASRAKTFNLQASIYNVKLKDTPNSCRESLQEAWQVASKESLRAQSLEVEVKKLKISLAQLKKKCVLYTRKRGTY